MEDLVLRLQDARGVPDALGASLPYRPRASEAAIRRELVFERNNLAARAMPSLRASPASQLRFGDLHDALGIPRVLENAGKPLCEPESAVFTGK